MNHPDTRYAAVGLDRVGYQTLGEGPRDLLFTTGMWSHLDIIWEDPAAARYLRRLAGFCRLIRFDRRGSGLSDPRPADGASIFEHWATDLLAVLDACGSQQPVLLATVDAGPMMLRFVERHPERCGALIFANTSACFSQAPGYPEGHAPAVTETVLRLLADTWGTEPFGANWNPSLAQSPATLRWYAKFQRAMAPPRVVTENLRYTQQLDAREVLASIRVPTLVITRRELKVFPMAQARYMSERIDGAQYAELAGADGDLLFEGAPESLALIEEFVTGQRRSGTAERVLATVLFTDIVESTRLVTKLGDEAWHALLDRHDRTVREEIERHGGRLVDSAGDGSLARFASPSAAIDCALALHKALAELKLRIRAGLHIGEIELRDDGRVGGIAVHIGARVLGRAEAGDVLVSRTVRDVLIGSPYRFKERGIHELKGIPSKWPLYAVEEPGE